MSNAPEPEVFPLPDIEALAEVAARFEAAQAEEALFASADPNEVIRHVPEKRVILRGHLGARPAIFKVQLSDREAVTREWTELRRVWAYMKDCALTVCTPLAVAPKAGIVVIADIPGTPLLKLLYETEPEERERWLKPAANWLRAYTQPTETTGDPDPKPWLTRARSGAEAQAFDKLRKIEKPILKEVERLASLLPEMPWRVAISHGDFHPNNLIARESTLTGIDCSGSLHAPIYKDMARFLMHMGRRGMVPSGNMRFGVDASGIVAFSDIFALGKDERELILPFFLGVEALMRAESRALPASRIRRAIDMSEALLEDLRNLAR